MHATVAQLNQLDQLAAKYDQDDQANDTAFGQPGYVDPQRPRNALAKVEHAAKLRQLDQLADRYDNVHSLAQEFHLDPYAAKDDERVKSLNDADKQMLNDAYHKIVASYPSPEAYEKERKAMFASNTRKRVSESWFPGVRATAVGLGTDWASPFLRLVGQGDLADDLNRFSDAYQQGAAAADEKGIVPAIIKRGMRGAARTIPTAVVSGRVAGPYGAIATMAGMEGNRAITTGKDAGLSGSDLAKYVATQGIIEAIPAAVMQRFGLGGLEKVVGKFGPGGNQAVAKGLGNALKQAGIATLEELPEEIVTEIGHNVADAVSGVDPTATDADRLQQTVLDTTVQTIITMGVVSAPNIAQSYIDEKVPEIAKRIDEGGNLSRREAMDLGAPTKVAGKAKSRRQWFQENRQQLEQRMQKPAEVEETKQIDATTEQAELPPAEIEQPTKPHWSAEDVQRELDMISTEREQLVGEGKLSPLPKKKGRKLGFGEQAVRDFADYNGLDSGVLIEAAREAHAQMIEEVVPERQAKTSAHKTVGLNSKDMEWLTNNGFDYAADSETVLAEGMKQIDVAKLTGAVRNRAVEAAKRRSEAVSSFDVWADETVNQYPEYFGAAERTSEAVWELLQKPVRKHPQLGDADVIARAAELHLAEKARLDETNAGMRDTAVVSPGLSPEDAVAGSKQTSLTSTKEEIRAELRGKRVDPPIEGVEPEGQNDWLDQAEAKIKNDPYWPGRVVEELLSKPRTLSPEEHAGMQIHYRRLYNVFDESTNRLVQAAVVDDPAARAIAQTDNDLVWRQMQQAEEAQKVAGREWGRAGVSQQIELLKDFSLAAVTRRARAAKAGEALTPEESARVGELSKRIQDLEGQLATRNAQLEIAGQLGEIDRHITVAKPKKRKPSARRVAAQQAVDMAWKDFGRKASGKLFSNPIDPELIISAAKLTKAYIDLGVTTFSELMASVAKHAGKKKAEASRATFATAWKQMKERGEAPTLDVDATNVAAVSRLAKKLMRSSVEAGIVEREAVVDAVHTELQEIIPDFTRRQTMDAMSGYGQYSQLTKDEVSTKVRDINGQLQQLGKLEDMQAGQAPKKTGVERRSPSDEERRLIQQVNEAKKKSGFTVTDPGKQLKSALDAAKTAARNRIADLETEIAARERTVKQRTSLEPDAELLDLRQRRDELNRLHQEIFPRQPVSMAKRIAAAEKAVDRAIEQLEADLETGNIGKKGRKKRLSSSSLDAKRAKLDALRAQRDELREAANPKLSPEERANLAYKRILTRRLAEYKDRMTRQDFAKKPLRKKSYDKETLDLKYQVEQEKLKFQAMEGAWRREQRTTVQKAIGLVPEALNTSRAILTSMDLSAVLRQGGFSAFSHPITSAKALPAMFRSLSKKGEFASAEELRSRPNASLYGQAKLAITVSEGRLSKQEEAYMGRWSKHIPGVAASERAYVTYLNRIRADVFDALVDQLGRGGQVTLEEARVIANFVNASTGRGSLGKAEAAAVPLATVFFSPRYVASRFQLLAGQPLWKGNSRTRKLLAMEYGRALAGIGTFYAIMMMLGGMIDDEEKKPTVELDPKSADFGKVRFGNTRLDPLAGLSQTSVLLSRVASGEMKNSKGKISPIRGKDVPYAGTNVPDVLARFLRSKLSPALGTAVDIASGKNVVGEPVTPGSVAVNSLVPLSFRDVYGSMKSQGIPRGTALALLAIFGMGLQTYEPRKSKKKGRKR